MTMQAQIEKAFDKKEGYTTEDYKLFEDFRDLLDKGKIRAAEKIDGRWGVNLWVKKGILLGFRLGVTTQLEWSEQKKFYDKDTYPEKRFGLENEVRIVPGGSSVRSGAYIGKNVTIMPPSYANVGAYVDDGSMLDSHSLVGSCAQIGKRVHISAGVMIGGVLEPIGNNPVIVEDDVFIGGNCGVYEGVIISERAVLAAGVILTSSTRVFDATKEEYLPQIKGESLIIPPEAVIVPGSRTLEKFPEISLYTPVIVKYRDSKTDTSVTLEDWLR
ncbi:MAG: 2,3,4,5-tetrahydropyridine-2,6-dicarboxylate N-succinyltransferase [Candidatus Cloacimonas sp.]